MARSTVRYSIEVRHCGRVAASVVCGPDLVIGDGGALVVPGVGDTLVLLREGRLVATSLLDGEVLAEGGTREAWPAESSSVGVRGCLRVVAFPEIELHIAPLETGVVFERASVRLIPPRETLVAAGLAACLVGFFTHTAAAEVLPWKDREEVIEPEATALVSAIFSAPRVEPTVRPVQVVAFREPPPPEPIPEPPTPEKPAALEPASPSKPGADAPDDGGALLEKVEAPVEAATADREAPRRGRSRRGRSRVDAPEHDLVHVLTSSSTVAMLVDDRPTEMSALSALDSGSGLQDLDSVEGGPGRAMGVGVPIAPHDRGGSDGHGEIGGLETSGGAGFEGAGSTGEQERRERARVDPPVEAAVEAALEAPKDPRRGKFDLDDAFAGHPTLARDQGGRLIARLHTSKGVIACDLFEDKVPNTVANFVGLALGTRESLDRETKQWRNVRLYDGTAFHRVIKGFVIQGGDPDGKGTGGPGYTIADEIVPELGHGSVGVLSMANRGPNTGGSQFFITLAGSSRLDGTSTVFGHCATAVPVAIGEVPVGPGDRPNMPVTLDRVEVMRVDPDAVAPLPEVAAPEAAIPDVEPPHPLAPVDVPGAPPTD